MLLHLSPRLLWPYEGASIVDLEINPLGLRLVSGVDLITGRPFPNKHHKVACRKTRHNKAYNGILIETAGPLDEFETVAHWAIPAEGAVGAVVSDVVTHRVNYRLLDRDFDAASEDMTLWYGTGAELGGWSDRWPVTLKGVPPMIARPIMEVLPGKDTGRLNTSDSLDAGGWIFERWQVFDIPTIERGRILACRLDDRMPPPDSAFFVAGVPEAPIRPKPSRRSESGADERKFRNEKL